MSPKKKTQTGRFEKVHDALYVVEVMYALIHASKRVKLKREALIELIEKAWDSA